ncbi:hypothetical protein J2Z32_003767 [Paenibacillus turicensis]|uniref:Uncharacterized protein n=1 Tax=Paenibacillus turicensis TaxID=160487 RepID=A0ABS4FX02_9BACL|nr:hypothetical protein [Paenibacillus turicensis]MBP1907102.1 hypothetical protein [Paenibacillus turicensis]
MSEPKVRLSLLQDDVQLSYMDGGIYTALELKESLEDERNRNDLSNKEWYLCSKKEWNPDPKYMMELYVEHEEHNVPMYEGWYERAMECLTEEHYNQIQAILDDAFKSESVSKYYALDDTKVIIDI